ncbi:hypothetical protein ACH5RR_011297 [Cinchona calisaya]|uniref:Uncharacterized protein n=1 Tax=Cinchona calisaya TaxID=153742 RepID=A0ABD3A4H1_9GENT
MASIRFTGLLIGVVIVSLALEYPSARALEGRGRKGKRLSGITSENHASSQNDVYATGVANNIAGRKGLLRGRKMQDSSKMSKQPKQKSTRMELPNSFTPSNSHQDASKAFLDAADEVVNLLRKDYGGKDRPRRNPPINNDEPTD